jgi:hypothetical protein
MYPESAHTALSWAVTGLSDAAKKLAELGEEPDLFFAGCFLDLYMSLPARD